ncbi:hypothetical protein Poly21_27910 [Allorhodopirellula heiligendammensis]|uniref:Uncharacterized protein n=1 Tax=Allorhodopirellula heiligendammensis TaxID=2714739 RepID=A0A5C6BXQ3_9BACT|nr:hypothetical protein Poly21_27910 [Allorhodopirellula heiligendammensis]
MMAEGTSKAVERLETRTPIGFAREVINTLTVSSRMQKVDAQGIQSQSAKPDRELQQAS